MLIPRPAGEVQSGRGRELVGKPPGPVAGDPSVADKATLAWGRYYRESSGSNICIAFEVGDTQ